MNFGILGILLMLIGMVVAVLAVIFVVVPLLKGVGWMIGGVFKGIGWVIAHMFEFIFGVIGDAVRLVGAVPVFLIFGLLALLNVVIGRWSASGHFCDAAMRECKIGCGCVYRITVRRPLKLVWLHGLLEGVEERVPAAMGEVPGRDKPSRRTGQFDGYTIVGSLRGGGSGAKLYIAEPEAEKKAAIPTIPDRVVIKSFALADGSSLPQIVRESRALECAKALGHVIEHGMGEHRFHYVMPYIPGDHLGVVTRDLHAHSDGQKLGTKQLGDVMDHVSDLLATLSAFHSGGFWHKDVKPENIIVNDGRAHLVDLGLVTALRSAMTLTTHGTEYFRDPEMVRQALRGVKVHQVDGAKFDVYAAGAVLYFMLENTFPAHGGLSAFHKQSPEALHWVVRRSMAEYHQRYQTAEAMLADLHFVNTHADAWKVKPAELPSMKGSEIPPIPVQAPDPVNVVSAGSPTPPRPEPKADTIHGYGVAAGVGAAGAFAQVGKFEVGSDGQPVPGAKKKGRRPRLRITNWWTGEYEAMEPASPVAPAAAGFAAAAAPGANVASIREQADQSWRSARAEVRRAGRSAKDQLASARGRAKAARERAQSRRHGATKAPSERQPSPALVAIGLVFIFVVFAGFFLFRGGATLRENVFAITESRTAVDPGPPVLIVNSHKLANHPQVAQAINAVREEYGSRGYDVFMADDALNNKFGPILSQWWQDRDGPADDVLEGLLAAHNVHALLHITGGGPRSVEPRFIYSDRRGSEDRRRITAGGPTQTVIVVNDYPEKDTTDQLPDRVYQHIEDLVGLGTATIIQNTFVANDLRPLVERASEGDPEAAAALDRLLKDNGADAVIWFVPDGSNSYVTHVHAQGNRAGVDAPVPHGASGRLLLVNNHPSMLHDNVYRNVKKIENFYRGYGFDVVDDTDAATSVLYELDLLSAVDDPAESQAIQQVLAEFNLDGIVLVEGGSGRGEPHERIDVSLIEADPSFEALQEAGRGG